MCMMSVCVTLPRLTWPGLMLLTYYKHSATTNISYCIFFSFSCIELCKFLCTAFKIHFHSNYNILKIIYLSIHRIISITPNVNMTSNLYIPHTCLWLPTYTTNLLILSYLHSLSCYPLQPINITVKVSVSPVMYNITPRFK